MKSEEERYISKGSQLHSSESDAASEDARCTPEDINQERVSSNSQSPTGSPTCLDSLVKQSSDVLQGIYYEGKLETSPH